MEIVANALSKGFGPRQAVYAVDLHIAAGEIYGLLGANGAGKTTTLRMLAGLMRPSSGHAAICGFDVLRTSQQAKAMVGFLTSSTGLYLRLTPRELLTYFGKFYGLTRANLPARIDGLSRMFGIEHLLDRQCGGLSNGEKQRISLARAMIHNPPVLILDEPMSGLDIFARRFVTDFIRYARSHGRAILFSTHYMAEAELICDRIGVLHHGRMLRQSTPLELKTEMRAQSLEEAFLRLIDSTSAKGNPA